jgi:hypothetical protein
VKRKWQTQLKGTGATPVAALDDLMKDQYALVVKGAIYLHPTYKASIDVLQLSEEDRPILEWEATTNVTLIGELEEEP